MKPTMVVDSLTLFSDDQFSTSTTLTPTTLKHITQIFESDECLKNIQQFEQSGFVPPLPSFQQQQEQQQQPKAITSKNQINFYCGGTTTIVSPVKVEPVATLALKVERDSSEESEPEFLTTTSISRHRKRGCKPEMVASGEAATTTRRRPKKLPSLAKRGSEEAT